MTSPIDAGPAESFRPSKVPQDLTDVLSILGVGTIGAAILLVTPFIVGYRLHGDVEFALRYVQLTGLGFALLFLPFIVWNVRIDARGMRFRRLLGSPRFLAWDRITGAEVVSRKEAVVNGIFFPWRAMSTGMSNRITIRIDWDRRRFYFPPGDVPGFRAAVRRWRPDLMPPEAEPPEAAKFLPNSEDTGNPYQAPLSDLVDRPDEGRRE